MSEPFDFEAFAEADGVDFREYLSMVVARLPKVDANYRAIQERIMAIYDQYPRVMKLYDREEVSALTEEECAAVIEIASLRNQRTEIELEASYFRGCSDSVGYLRKAGIL